MHTCQRCNGKGEIQQHRNVLGGICFACSGTGKSKTKPRKARGVVREVAAYVPMEIKDAPAYRVQVIMARKAQREAIAFKKGHERRIRKIEDVQFHMQVAREMAFI